MRVAVFGAGGLLGGAQAADARSRGDEVLALPHGACDIADEAAVERALAGFRLELILNAAAFTDVDRAEREPDPAWRANADGPRVLAAAARALGARLVHVSTDYVFAGEGGRREPFAEDDPIEPRGVYARSKRAGEEAVLASGAPGAIVARSAWVYGPGGKNFVTKIPEILRAKGEMAVVADQWSSPTRADELARALRALAGRGAEGLFHVAAAGAASYHEVALEAARALGIDPSRVRPIESRTLSRPAPRPTFSALRSARLGPLGVPALRPWAESYREFASGQ